MKTRNRLTAAYETAHVLEFDDDSRFVFFSDAHRGDGSRADEFTKNRTVFAHALDRYWDDGYTLVELGDQEDLWEFPHIRHIIKAHGPVYDRLRRFHDAGRYVRLFGNHDRQLGDPRYVRQNLTQAPNPITNEMEPLFPGIEVHGALLLRHRWSGQEILIVHGHQGDLSNDQNWRFTMITFRMVWKWLHAFGIVSPSSPIRNSYKRHKVERNYVKWIREHRIALICGHTHRSKFPRIDETPYFNTGGATFNGYITGLELADDRLSLVSWRVVPDVNGYLHVARRLSAGPEPVGAYDRKQVAGLPVEEENYRQGAARAASRRVPARHDGRRKAGGLG